MKRFQIAEDDLATLERDLPAIADRLMAHLRFSDRVAFRRIQQIVLKVRWNYGPPTHVERVDDDTPEGGAAAER